jgi:hypothetical protein
MSPLSLKTTYLARVILLPLGTTGICVNTSTMDGTGPAGYPPHDCTLRGPVRGHGVP